MESAIQENQKLSSGQDLVQAARADPVAAVPVIDTRIPEIFVVFQGTTIDQVLIDGGARVNITNLSTCQKMGWLEWTPTPFLVRMADQRRVSPLGLLTGVVIEIGKIMSFVVLNMKDANQEYNLLLGRPWLQDLGCTRLRSA